MPSQVTKTLAASPLTDVLDTNRGTYKALSRESNTEAQINVFAVHKIRRIKAPHLAPNSERYYQASCIDPIYTLLGASAYPSKKQRPRSGQLALRCLHTPTGVHLLGIDTTDATPSRQRDHLTERILSTKSNIWVQDPHIEFISV
jgi:hypothetical protein